MEYGIKLEVSKREPVEQTVIGPILALFVWRRGRAPWIWLRLMADITKIDTF